MQTGREIKFRAWDKETKEMSHDFLNRNWLRVCIESPYVELMQFTGLYDKNGKEIYEGDIVKNHRRASTFGEELLQVIWQEAVIDTAKDGVRWTSEKPGFRLIRIGRGMTTVYVSDEDLEVIGNIYENPELLEVGS